MIKNKGKIVSMSSGLGRYKILNKPSLQKELDDPNLDMEGLNKLVENYEKSFEIGKNDIEGWGENPYSMSKLFLNVWTRILGKDKDL